MPHPATWAKMPLLSFPEHAWTTQLAIVLSRIECLAGWQDGKLIAYFRSFSGPRRRRGRFAVHFEDEAVPKFEERLVLIRPEVLLDPSGNLGQNAHRLLV